MKVKDAFKNLSERFSKKGEHYGYLLNKGRLKLEIDRAILALNDANIEFDTIAVQGVSGLLFGSPLAAALGKGLIIVRRPDDEQNLTFPFGIKGYSKNQNILLVDDCVRTGATVKRVVDKLDEFCKPYTLAGALFYNVGWTTGNYPKTFFDNGIERPVIILPDETPPLIEPKSALGIFLKSVPGGEVFTK